ncbi:hypothetical protein pb186bvf_003184 [Paramecium bursaria]
MIFLLNYQDQYHGYYLIKYSQDNINHNNSQEFRFILSLSNKRPSYPSIQTYQQCLQIFYY